MNGLADELRLPLYDEILHLTGKLILSQENMARYLERRQVAPAGRWQACKAVQDRRSPVSQDTRPPPRKLNTAV